MQTIDLPKKNLEEARGRIRASLTEGTRQEQQMAYRHIVATISHPAARFRGRCVRGTTELQYLLNLVIVVKWPMYVLFLGLGIFLSSWWFLGLPLWLVCDFGLLNRLQTWINCELASRLVAFDELIDQDEDFRSRALAALEKTEGTPQNKT
jgi:hypothetical protein